MIWESCERIMLDNVDLRNCTWEEILFGVEECNKGKQQLVNYVLILVKYVIFKVEKMESHLLTMKKNHI